MKADQKKEVIIVHFGELWLRGRNRGTYISRLKRNVLSALRNESFELRQEYDRLLVWPSDDSDTARIKRRLSNVFGISNYYSANISDPSLKGILSASKEMFSRLDGDSVIKISAHRSYKGHKFDSKKVVTSVLRLAEARGVKLSSKENNLELRINVTKTNAFLSIGKEKGLRGLPVGSSGKGVVLLSGGIDSPVAAWYAMKRGIDPVYVHLHAMGSNEEASGSKIGNIATLLSKYSNGCKIYYVPSHFFQLSALKAGRYELIMLKAFMLSLAEKIAAKEGASLIFTGESLGQVASQTSSNIAAESYGIRMPILRPLIGFDKEEIIAVAKRIGTYETSILPYKDVCSINSRNPKTGTSIETVRELRKELGISSIVRRSLLSSSVTVIPDGS